MGFERGGFAQIGLVQNIDGTCERSLVQNKIGSFMFVPSVYNPVTSPQVSKTTHCNSLDLLSKQTPTKFYQELTTPHTPHPAPHNSPRVVLPPTA